MANKGLTRTQEEALALFLLGREMRARYAGYDAYYAYDIAEGEGPGVRRGPCSYCPSAPHLPSDDIDYLASGWV